METDERRSCADDKTSEVIGPPVGTWQVDLLSRRASWSEETARLIGRVGGDRPTLRALVRRVAPNDRRALWTAIERAVVDDARFDVALALLRADGTPLAVRCTGSIERRDGRAARLRGTVRARAPQEPRRAASPDDAIGPSERVAERLALATESGGIGIWDYDVASGSFVWDERMCALHGLDAAGASPVDAERWLAFVVEGERERVREAAASALRGDGPDELEFGIVRADGERRHLHGTARVIRDAEGEIVRLVGTGRDITATRRTTRELARQHRILEATLGSIADGVITVDRAGSILWMSPVAAALAGRQASAARGRPLGEVIVLVDEHGRKPVPDPLRRPFAGDEGGKAEVESALLLTEDGRERVVEYSATPIRSEESGSVGAVLVLRDVTERRATASELTWRATHDELTGLLNRAEFERRIARLHARSAEPGETHALLVIDLDRFQIVVDSCGYASADRLLGQVGRLIERIVRPNGTPARLGGDEFAVILERSPIEEAQSIAQRIREVMDGFRFVHREQRLRISASIGLVPLDGRWSDVSTILRAADTACRTAKEAGRNRVHLLDDTDRAMHARRTQTRWATRLEAALDADGFELHAHRIDALEALGRVTADPTARRGGAHAEILVRLRDEDGSLIAPGAFLPAAERFNLINRLDRWVLGRVIDWLATNRERMDVGALWINLSGQSFGDRHFQRDTLARLEAAGGSICAALCLEITETAAVTHLADAASFISELRALGVRVALDDFGAGVSSFGYLKKLPIDYLKIDGQFVRDLNAEPLDAAAVRCFAEVARVMHVETVAEFVETPEVLETLREIGIDYVQGWLTHRPAPIDELIDARGVEPAFDGDEG